jgi:peptidoglycan/xylan/chitin deacetylase (PgdA/CDA1 family)
MDYRRAADGKESGQMRILTTSLAVLGVAASVFAGSDPARADKPSCSERKGVLGVSRVVEIDTTKGPRFGNMQYKDIDFLKRGEIVLTFDDGPLRPKTTSVLNALEAHCTKATFFMVGRMALVDPSMVREIDKRGHTVAMHSWSHKMQGRLSKAGGEKEIELGVSAVSLALGKPAAPFFRFPYLSDPKRMQDHLKDRDVGIFSIDIDSLDFRTRSGSVMMNRVLRGLKRQGKGIILMHDIQRSTAGGIKKLLDALADAGYKVVHIVPKAPIKTLKKYDEMAQKEADRRKKIASRRPLASRSIVWPVSSATDFPTAEPLKIIPRGLFKGPLPERSGLVRPPAAKLRESLLNDAKEEEEKESQPVQRKTKKSRSASVQEGAAKEDWRNKIFSNPN